MEKSFLSPKVKLQKTKIGKGLVVKKPIQVGELVVDFSTGPGKHLSLKKADQLYDLGSDYMIQVGENEFFVATNKKELEDADYINHSCNPTCGIKGSLKIVAMRDIFPGEEISIDYSMSESSNYEFKCECGSDICRQIITGQDWQKKELQKKYLGYFYDYLQNKILLT